MFERCMISLISVTRNFLFAVSFLSLSGAFSQPIAYFNIGAFHVPGQKPFLETYLTLVGSSLQRIPTGSSFRSSVNIDVLIKKDSNIVKAAKYHLNGPDFTDTLKIPSFIDNQRYTLENGTYLIEISIKDPARPKGKPTTLLQKFTLSFSDKEIQGSSVQVLESFKRTSAPTPISKSGYDLVPYNVNYFPESQNELAFYFEAYNTENILGKGRPFVFSYFIETADKLKKLENYGAFRKQQAAAVNPLLSKIDISKLGTGNYNLVIELRDSSNKLQHEAKYFFQRLNRTVDIATLYEFSQKKTVSDYFGACNNNDTLKMFVECLWPIAGTVDKERVINTAIKKDPQQMKNFVIDFWQRRAADTANPLKLWAEYYREVQQVMVLFKCGKQPGYYTERGRVYLQYGAPNQRSQQNNDLNTWPYEIWQYYRINDRSTGYFYSNRKFVFVNRNIADDCHVLVHSDMPGEINNPRWQYEVTRRNSQGIENFDQTKPQGTQFNQFEDIYTNPR